MLKIATLAAVAAVLLAGPAAAADAIHISTAGKTPEQLKAEIHKAAVKVCNAEVGDSLLAYYLQTPCVKSTVKAAIAQSGDALKVASR
jgi:hypothetical protein